MSIAPPSTTKRNFDESSLWELYDLTDKEIRIVEEATVGEKTV